MRVHLWTYYNEVYTSTCARGVHFSPATIAIVVCVFRGMACDAEGRSSEYIQTELIYAEVN